MLVKPCVKCGAQERHLSNGNCVPCAREGTRRWREANPEKAREADRRRRKRERAREGTQRWREENPERAREARRRWREENPERVLEADRRYREASPEKVREKGRRYREKKRARLSARADEIINNNPFLRSLRDGEPE